MGTTIWIAFTVSFVSRVLLLLQTQELDLRHRTELGVSTV